MDAVLRKYLPRCFHIVLDPFHLLKYENIIQYQWVTPDSFWMGADTYENSNFEHS